MSFYMDVEIDDLTWNRAREIASRCSPAEGLQIITPRRGRFAGRGPTKLVISDRLGNESVLADDADWNAPTWSMRPEAIPQLESTLRCLFRHVPEGFRFIASWVSDPLEKDVELSGDELLELIRGSALNGRTRYKVKPQPVPADQSQLRPLQDWEERLVAVFREVAAMRPEARLSLGMGGPGALEVEVTLDSSNPNCAPVTALLTTPTQVDLTLGEHIPIELWYKKNEAEELVEDLRDWVMAVVDGHFQETAWRRGGQVLKSRGRIVVAGKEKRCYYRSLPATLTSGRTQKTVHRYEPYA